MAYKTFDYRLNFPGSLIVAGSGFAGKSYFVLNLIHNKDILFREKIEKVVYIYGAYQPKFDKFKESHPFITFISVNENYEAHIIKDIKAIIVFDDVLVNLERNSEFNQSVTEFFLQRCHHSNLFCILLIQNIFAKNIRNLSLNCTYLCLFKNIRDKSSISYLGKQFSPGHPLYLTSALNDATKSKPYTFLFLDFSHDFKDDDLRVRNFVIPNQDMKIYLPS